MNNNFTDEKQRTEKSEKQRVLAMMEEGKLSESEGRKVLNALEERKKEQYQTEENTTDESDSSGWNSSTMYLIYGGIAGLFIGLCLIPVSFLIALLSALNLDVDTNRKTVRSEKDTEYANDFAHEELIDRPGKYELDPEEYKLNVALKSDQCNHLVEYKLENTERDDRLLASGKAGSNHSRWFFYWSDRKKLWIYSGNRGLFMLVPGEEREYEHRRVTLENQDLVAQIPDPVYQNLPLSLRNKKEERQRTDPDHKPKDQDDRNFRITSPVQKSLSYRETGDETK